MFPGLSLWNRATIEASRRNESKPYQNTEYRVEENVNNRLSLFKVDAELKLSFLGGLIEVSGETVAQVVDVLTHNIIRCCKISQGQQGTQIKCEIQYEI